MGTPHLFHKIQEKHKTKIKPWPHNSYSKQLKLVISITVSQTPKPKKSHPLCHHHIYLHRLGSFPTRDSYTGRVKPHYSHLGSSFSKSCTSKTHQSQSKSLWPHPLLDIQLLQQPHLFSFSLHLPIITLIPIIIHRSPTATIIFTHTLTLSIRRRRSVVH